MSKLPTMIGCLICLLGASSALGHNLWVSWSPDAAGKSVVTLWVNDEAEQGRASLLKRVEKAKVWAQVNGASAEKELEFQLVEQGKLGALIDKAATSEVFRLEAVCDNGVRPARPEAEDQRAFRMLYYAKYLNLDTDHFGAVLTPGRLAFDFLPQDQAGTPILQLVHNDKPVAGCEVILTVPGGNDQYLTTDAQGVIVPKLTGAGRYTVRARLDTEEPGQHEGLDYKKTTRRITLVIDVPEGSPILQ